MGSESRKNDIYQTTIGPADHFPLLGRSNGKLDKNEPLVLEKCIGGLFLCKILNKLLLMRGKYHVHDEI